MRILVRGLNQRIGDNIMTFPFLYFLRKLSPHSEIHLTIPEHLRPLFEYNPHINSIIVYDPYSTHKDLKAKVTFIKQLKRTRYAAAFLLQRSFESAFMAKLAGIKHIVGYTSDHRTILLTHKLSEQYMLPHLSNIHQTKYFIRLLEAYFKIEITQIPQEAYNLYISSQIIDRTRECLKAKGYPYENYVVVSFTTTYGTAKMPNLPLINNIISKLSYPAFIVGREEERETIYLITTYANNKTKLIPLVGELDLEELIGLIANSIGVISIDNGISHIAAALGKPLYLIFPTTTNYFFSKALGSSKLKVLTSGVACARCFQLACPLGHHLCTKDLIRLAVNTTLLT